MKDDETKKEELVSKGTQMVQNTPKRAVHDEAWKKRMDKWAAKTQTTKNDTITRGSARHRGDKTT